MQSPLEQQGRRSMSMDDPKKATPVPENHVNRDVCPLFDNATLLMLAREESLLGEIVGECNALMDIAREQAEQVADDIEFRL